MKKLISIMLCLLLVLGGAGAEICIRLDDGALLLRRDGGETVPLGVYEDIVPLGGGLYAARQDGLFALMDKSGSLKTEFIFTFMEWSGDVLIAQSGNMRALLTPGGEMLTPFAYTRIQPDGSGRFWAIKADGSDLESDELFVLDIYGNETATGLFIRRMGEAGEGSILPVMRPSSGLWGYCDTDGEMIIPALYSYASPFRHGLAAVVQGGFWGVIGTDGQTVVAPQYDYLEICPGGFLLAGLSQQGVWVLDLNGNEIAYYEGEETGAAPMSEGYAVYDGEAVTLYSAAGEVIVQGGQGASAADGLDGQVIFADGPWGEKCVGLAGTEPRYQNLYPLGYANDEPVYAYMVANSARYINDRLGEVQVSVDMESARYGVVNSEGEVLIPAEFESILYLDEDRLLCRVDNYHQVMDTAGNIYWSRGVRQIEESSS